MFKRMARPIYHALLAAIPADVALRIQFFNGTGSWPNLRKPQTFNEKVLHRKLHERNAVFTRLADKIAVKDFVRQRLGDAVVIPTLWSGKRLPDDAATRFHGRLVVKSSHTSGRNVFVDDAAAADWPSIRRTSERWLAEPWNLYVKERWYNRMERQLLIEQFIGEGSEPPSDYKFFVFDGVVRAIQFDIDRFKGHKRSFYSSDWQRLPATLIYPPVPWEVPRPKHLDAMIEIAGTLGQELSFVRVDLYDLSEGPRFGEMTFAPDAGFGRFTPRTFDAELGAYWTGPTI